MTRPTAPTARAAPRRGRFVCALRHAGQGMNPTNTAQPITSQLIDIVALRVSGVFPTARPPSIRTLRDWTRLRRIPHHPLKFTRATGLLLSLALCLTGTSTRSAPPAPLPPAAEVYFSPHGGCTEAVVRELGKARQTVLVQAYSFTSKPIAAALVAAHQRGVAVTIILDDGDVTARGSVIGVVVAGGDTVLLDAKHAIAHNKIMVIDGAVVLTGSFNFTAAAENSNAENLLVLRSAALATQYTANWHEHEAHSTKYAPAK